MVSRLSVSKRHAQIWVARTNGASIEDVARHFKISEGSVYEIEKRVQSKILATWNAAAYRSWSPRVVDARMAEVRWFATLDARRKERARIERHLVAIRNLINVNLGSESVDDSIARHALIRTHLDEIDGAK